MINKMKLINWNKLFNKIMIINMINNVWYVLILLMNLYIKIIINVNVKNNFIKNVYNNGLINQSQIIDVLIVDKTLIYKMIQYHFLKYIIDL